jgi:NTP pyrophosphatase (non-canonical NTP hydrolase)
MSNLNTALFVSQYEMIAKKTASYKEVEYLVCGLGEEVGELLHEYAAMYRVGGLLDGDKVKSEMGDIIWVLSQIARESGFTLEDAMRDNMEKLSKREKENSIHDKSKRGD